MYEQELRRAIEAAPRMKLPNVAKAMYGAFAAGHLTEDQTRELQSLIDVRQVVPAPSNLRKSVGSRPRSPASIERRRRWAGAGRMPNHLLCRFSLAEQAVLAIVAVEVTKHGACTLCVSHIAALAGVGETSVRNALRHAQALGLVAVEHRRVAAWRNLTNRVTITSVDWLTWLKRSGGSGFKLLEGTDLPLPRKGRSRPTRGYREVEVHELDRVTTLPWEAHRRPSDDLSYLGTRQDVRWSQRAP